MKEAVWDSHCVPRRQPRQNTGTKSWLCLARLTHVLRASKIVSSKRGPVASYPTIIRKQKSGKSGKARTPSPLGLVVPYRPGYEVKFITNPMTAAFASVSTTTSFIDITALIGAGTDYFNRVGRQITLSKLQVSGLLVGGQTNLAVDDSYNSFRITVAAGNTGMTWTPYGLTQVLSADLVPGLDRVLYDRVFPLSSPGRDSTGYMKALKRIEINLDLPKIVTHFQTAAAGSQNGNTVYLVMVSDSVAVPNPGFVDGSWVLRFVDN